MNEPEADRVRGQKKATRCKAKKYDNLIQLNYSKMIAHGQRLRSTAELRKKEVIPARVDVVFIHSTCSIIIMHTIMRPFGWRRRLLGSNKEYAKEVRCEILHRVRPFVGVIEMRWSTLLDELWGRSLPIGAITGAHDSPGVWQR